MVVESITFYSEGEKVHGNIHLSSLNRPCAVTLHGLDSSKDSGKWLTFASKLCENGYACLRFNFRSCGDGAERSDGKFEYTSLTARIQDYRSALDFLQADGRVDMDRVGVIGSSFGGMVAIAAEDRRAKAIVTLATPYKIPQFEKLQVKEEGNCYALPSGRKLSKGFYEDLQKYNLLKSVKNAPPILIIHGELDEVVPFNHAQILYGYAPKPKRLAIIKGANHVFSNAEHLNKVIQITLQWFEKHLKNVKK